MPLGVRQHEVSRVGVHRVADDLGIDARAPGPGVLQFLQAQNARALAQEPKVLLADEPVASLDPVTSHVVMRDLQRINRELGITTIINLHFLDLAGRLASRLARLARDAEPEATEVRLDWPYTQSDLASMIGGTRQSVNKLLSDLADRELVIIEKDTLIIPDVEALELEAER